MELKELYGFLYASEIKRKVIETNASELELATLMLQFTEDDLFQSINEIHDDSDDEKVLTYVLNLLFVQSVKSFKSSLILNMNGYFTTSIVVMRNLLESVFNIKYILEDARECYKRAKDYLDIESKWTKESVKTRAYWSLDSTLYNVYRHASDYTHSNLLATSQNITENGELSSAPTDEKISDSITLSNSIYYYLLEYVCGVYGVNFNKIENIEKTHAFKHRLKTYKMFNFARAVKPTVSDD